MNRITILLILIILASCQKQETVQVQTTLVKKGTFTEELNEQGTIRAVNSIAINMPMASYRYSMMKISDIVADGTEVEAGDTVVIFDPSEVRKAIVNTEQQLEIAKAEYEKMKATQQSEIEDLEADHEISRINHEIARIKSESAVYQSEIERKQLELALENSRIAVERAREQIDNRKKVQQEELFQKDLTIKQQRIILEESEKFIRSLFVTSPAKGIAIIRDNWMTGQKYQAGDTPYGGAMVDLPDLSEMYADVKINEVDISKIVKGLPVTLKADAYSDSTYTGEVTQVANLAQNKDYQSRIKVFPIQIKIDGINKGLLPGLTVSCRIRVRDIPDVLFVPSTAIFKDQGIEYVYVKSGSSFKKRDVRIGANNTDFAVILEGLSENEEVALTDPFVTKQGENTGTQNNQTRN